MSQRVPNFFLAGAAKCGTTSLYHYLGQHPDVFMSPVKEPSFFAAEDIRRWSFPEIRRMLERPYVFPPEYLDGTRRTLPPGLILEWDDYLQLFRHVRDERAVGEASPNYFGALSAPRAIHERLPHAKIILVLRHPAERLYSLYASALALDTRPTFRDRYLAGRAGSDVWSTILGEARYATNLKRFFQFFPREQVKVLLYEDLQKDSRAVLREIFDFLGVSPDFPVDPSQRHNESTIPRYPRLHALRRLAPGAPWFNLLPSPLRRLGRRLYHRARSDLQMQPADRRFIVDLYRDETIETAELIGRDLTAWLR